MKRITLIISCFLIFSSVFNVESKTVSKKKDASEVLQSGRDAFFNYDFEEAEELYEEYENLQTKAKKPLDENLERWQKELNIANNAFGRVQKIEVIDSINMPRSTFFKAFNLKPSAGKIGPGNSFNLNNGISTKEIGYINEDEDYFITSVPGEDGNLQLIESRKLLDGSWESRKILDGDFEIEGDYAFPFLHGDGQSLYFANNGEDSMGGYDLFVVQKEPITGVCLQPLNLGMPFNSPYDDFMIAIDEERGLGWWATDRNNPGGDVTIYVYILDEIRNNYPSDTVNLKDFAKISSYKSTQNPQKLDLYKKILSDIKKSNK